MARRQVLTNKVTTSSGAPSSNIKSTAVRPLLSSSAAAFGYFSRSSMTTSHNGLLERGNARWRAVPSLCLSFSAAGQLNASMTLT
eukprot:12813337-Ditylum_brightwellii.AAC.1